MTYNHILVAVDFDEGTEYIINKAIELAKPLNAKVSLVHANNQLTNATLFSGLIDTDLSSLEPAQEMVSELRKQLDELVDKIDYSIERKFIVNGNITHDLAGPVKEAGIDLIICGHHHDFWSRMRPSAAGLLNTSPVDILIVSLED